MVNYVQKLSIKVKGPQLRSKTDIYGQKPSITVNYGQLRSKTINYGQRRGRGGGVTPISEQLPVFRAPREDEGRSAPVHGRGMHGKGTTYGQTSRLLDRIGPVGRFGEKHDMLPQGAGHAQILRIDFSEAGIFHCVDFSEIAC